MFLDLLQGSKQLGLKMCQEALVLDVVFEY